MYSAGRSIISIMFARLGLLSRLWWARLGSFFVRSLHMLLYIRHCLFLYVDDFFTTQDESTIFATTSLVLAFFVCFNVPVSWRKLAVGPEVVWIGWCINVRAGCFSIPQSKRQRLHAHISSLLRSYNNVHRRDLHKVTGMLQWFLNAFPHLRPWIGVLDKDLRCPPATLHSLDPHYFAELHSCVNDDLLFVKAPSGTAIPLGAKLIEVRHMPIKRRSDLSKIVLSCKRVWIRVSDPSQSKRKLSKNSVALLTFWQRWCDLPALLRPLQFTPRATLVAAADAMGAGTNFAIGGFVKLSSATIWFSEQYTVSDFGFAGIELSSRASDNISCYECLAQIALLHCLSAALPGGRMHVRIPSWSDNTGAEAVSNKLFTSSYPLSIFAQRLALFSCFSGIELDTTHISGHRNELADWLSRWNGTDTLPSGIAPEFRVRLDLRQLWFRERCVSFHPADFKPPWNVPTLQLFHDPDRH